MNRIEKLFREKHGNILSIYFTAGHPQTGSTASVIRALAAAGADMIEIGIPFSDPMADGPVIQKSSERALKQGMTLSLLFRQLEDIRSDVKIPLLLMGYLNPVMQYGWERFCSDCRKAGIDGTILPDLPFDIFEGDPSVLGGLTGSEPIASLYEKSGLANIYLVSPQTSDDRVRQIDRASRGFIYMVSASSTTGIRKGFSDDQKAYFERIRSMKLKHPCLIGFGIAGHEEYVTACSYSAGAIVGSAFVRMLEDEGESGIAGFVRRLREGK